MSKLSAAWSTSHTLSMTAMEEASRVGDRTAGIDHLFLALVVNEQIAGQVLRSFGITLDKAREAVAAQHSEQIDSLGVHARTPAPGRITFPETGGYEWSKAAIELIKQSGTGKKRADAAAVLRELIAEPSGLIEAILRRLDVSADEIRARLDDAEQDNIRPHRRYRRDGLAATRESFLPAPVSTVWALLSDPSRMPEWEPGTGSVTELPQRTGKGARWLAHAQTQSPDGKTYRVKPRLRRAQVEVLDDAEQQGIEWVKTWIDSPTSNRQRIRIELEPAAGGTRLLLSVAWVPKDERERGRAFRGLRRGLRLLLWPLLRPLQRFGLWVYLTQLSGSISRALR